MAISRQLITRDKVEIVRAEDGAVWSITRDQVLAMFASMSRPQAISGIKDSLADFLDIPLSEINSRIQLSVFLTGEVQELTLNWN